MEGIGYFDIFDWTWGEVLDYLKVRREARRRTLKDQAEMNFFHASIIARMIGGESKSISPEKEYPWLYTKEELNKIKEARLRRAVGG